MKSERVINKSTIEGCFILPAGVRFLQREVLETIKTVTVSTVCLEGAHLEDPLHICDPEHGFETMVFLEECTFFSLFTAKYKTRAQALRGHKDAVKKLLSGKMPLSIPLGYYTARAEVAEQTAQNRARSHADTV